MPDEGRKGPAGGVPRPGEGTLKAPAREATILGVGNVTTEKAPAAPIVAVTPPSREKTVLGVGVNVAKSGASAPGVARIEREPSVEEPPPEDWDLPAAPAEPEPAPAMAEKSLPVELVAKKAVARASEPPESEPSQIPRRRQRWPVVMLVLAAAGAGTFAMRDRIPWWYRVRAFFGEDAPSPQAPASEGTGAPAVPSASAASVAAAESASASAAAPSASASAGASSGVTASASPGVSASGASASPGMSASASAAASVRPSPSASPSAARRATPAPKPSKSEDDESPY
jgi:hypothetical protein